MHFNLFWIKRIKLIPSCWLHLEIWRRYWKRDAIFINTRPCRWIWISKPHSRNIRIDLIEELAILHIYERLVLREGAWRLRGLVQKKIIIIIRKSGFWKHLLEISWKARPLKSGNEGKLKFLKFRWCYV